MSAKAEAVSEVKAISKAVRILSLGFLSIRTTTVATEILHSASRLLSRALLSPD